MSSDTIASDFLHSVIKRFRYYQTLGEKAMAQLDDGQLFVVPDSESNSIGIMVQHLAGNMLSRWTNFLVSDGEKSWRHRDREFEIVLENRRQLDDRWREGWDCLFDALENLQPANLGKTVTIRGEDLSVIDAIHRQLAHYAYHIGQIVFLARQLKGPQWESLSIPRGQSEAFNLQLADPQRPSGKSKLADLSEAEQQELAAQLRRPEGDFGAKVAAEMSKGNHALTLLVYDLLQLGPGEDFLEAGMGNGALWVQIAERLTGGSICGLDYSPDMVAAAKTALPEGTTVTVSVHEGRIEKMPFSDNSFDKICTVNTIYFWENPPAAFAEFRRVLKDGGLFAIGYRSRQSLSEFNFVKFGFTLYDPAELQSLAMANGFTLVRHEQQPDGDFDACCLVVKKDDSNRSN